jgi:hypothetical protein
MRIVANKSVETPATTLLIDHLHKVINSSASEVSKKKAKEILSRITKSEKSAKIAE